MIDWNQVEFDKDLTYYYSIILSTTRGLLTSREPVASLGKARLNFGCSMRP